MWKELIETLNARGFSDAEIARRAGVSQPTISRLRSGAARTTAYETGCALVALRDEARGPAVPSAKSSNA